MDFRSERRSRETHASHTDRDALLFKKAASKAARLCYMGHALIENRHGLVVDVQLTQATYGFHDQLTARDVVAHVAWNAGGKRRPIPEELEGDPPIRPVSAGESWSKRSSAG